MKIRQNPLWGFGRKLYESTEYYWSIQKISSRGFNRIILEDSTEFMQFYRISMGELLLFYALPVECNRMLLKDSTKSFPKYSTESIRKVQPKRSREFHRISSVNSSESFTGDTNINVDKVSVRILSSSQRKKNMNPVPLLQIHLIDRPEAVTLHSSQALTADTCHGWFCSITRSAALLCSTRFVAHTIRPKSE